jgi:DNA-binding MarR family transcriptional regulator
MRRLAPSNLEDHLGYWLRCLSNFVSESFALRLEKQGVSVAQWVVLRTLYDGPGVTLNHAAELIGVDKSTLSRMMDRLVKKGWVDRSAGGDRRSVELKLTAAARALVPRLARLADENDAALFRALSAKQRNEFLATIQHLLHANRWSTNARGRDRMA